MGSAITVRVNDLERKGVDEGWIAQAIGTFRRAGRSICVRVTVQTDDGSLTLAKGMCPAGGGTPSNWNSFQTRLIEAWQECGPQAGDDLQPGAVIPCIKRIERLVA